MATVINNPGNDSGTGVGTVIGIIIAIVLLFVLIRWGIPALRGEGGNSANINVEVPTPGSNGGGQ